MNSEVKMTVSSMTRHGDNKAIYVLFNDEKKSAEFAMPEAKLLSNDGFADDEIAQFTDYLKNEQDYIYSIAKKVNPMKGFLGQPQGV